MVSQQMYTSSKIHTLFPILTNDKLSIHIFSPNQQ